MYSLDHIERILSEVPDNSIFFLSDGTRLKSLNDLSSALQIMDNSIFLNHVSSEKNDFSLWIKDTFQDVELAELVLSANTPKILAKIISSRISYMNSSLAEIKNAIVQKNYIIKAVQELSELKKTIQGKDEQINSIFSEIEKLKKNNELLFEENSSLLKKIDSDANDIGYLFFKKKISEKDSEIKEFNENISGLTKKITTFENIISKINAEKIDLENKNNILLNEIKHYKEHVEEKNKKVEEYVSLQDKTKKGINELKEELDEHKKIIFNYNKKISDHLFVNGEFKKKLNLKDKEISEIKKEMNVIDKKARRFEEMLDDKSKRLSELNIEKEELKKKGITFESEKRNIELIEEEKLKINESLEVKCEENKKLHSELNKLEKEFTIINKDLKKTKENHEQSNNELKENNKKILELENKNKHINVINKNLVDEISISNKIIDDNNLILSKLSIEKEEKIKLKKSFNLKCEEIKILHSEIKKLLEKNENIEFINKTLSEKISVFNNIIEQNNNKIKGYESLVNNSRKESGSIIDDFDKKLVYKNREIEIMQNQLVLMEKNVIDLTSDIASKEYQIEILSKEKNGLSKDLNSHFVSKESLEREIIGIIEEKVKLENDISEKSEEIRIFHTNVSLLSKEKEELIENKNTIEMKNSFLTDKVEKLTFTNDKLITYIKNIKSSHNKLKDQFDNHKEHVSIHHRTNEEIKKEYEHRILFLNKNIDSLRKEIDDYMINIAELKRDKENDLSKLNNEILNIALINKDLSSENNTLKQDIFKSNKTIENLSMQMQKIRDSFVMTKDHLKASEIKFEISHVSKLIDDANKLIDAEHHEHAYSVYQEIMNKYRLLSGDAKKMVYNSCVDIHKKLND